MKILLFKIYIFQFDGSPKVIMEELLPQLKYKVESREIKFTLQLFFESGFKYVVDVE